MILVDYAEKVVYPAPPRQAYGGETSKIDGMPKRLAEADPRRIEQIARAVPGVAVAEIVEAEHGRRVLRVVVWQDSHPESVAGRVEIALREEMGLTLEGGDLTLAGTTSAGHAGVPEAMRSQSVPPGPPGSVGSPDATSSSGAASFSGAEGRAGERVRVIELGDNIWAAEHGAPLPPLPHPSHHGMEGFRLRPAVALVTVSRSGDRATARVEIDAGDGARPGEAVGAATDSRIRLLVCEAAALAAASALGLAALDVVHAVVVGADPSYATVIVVEAVGEGHDAAGVARIGADPMHSFAVATLHAAAALRSPLR